MDTTERTLLMLWVLRLDCAPSPQIPLIWPDVLRLPVMLGASLTSDILEDRRLVYKKNCECQRVFRDLCVVKEALLRMFLCAVPKLITFEIL